jgi:hypothetical protein
MNHEAVGKVGETFELDVERGKIREFARAVKSEHPAYLTGTEPVVPPTFLSTILHWERGVPGANPWLLVDMDQRRGLHAEQEYRFFGPPPRAGTRLTCRSRIDSIYEKQGRRGGTLTFAVMVTEFFDASGKLVAEARMTGVETAKTPEGVPTG